MIKKIIPLIFLFLITNNIFSQTKYFQEYGKTRIYTEDELNEKKLVIQTKYAKSFPKAKVNIHIVENKIFNDLDVAIFKINVKVKKNRIIRMSERKEKVFELINKPFPNFKLSDINGKKYSMTNLKGKPTVFNFWFAGCQPCKKEMPVLNKIKQKYNDKVNFISITFDNESVTRKILEQHKFDFIKLINGKKLFNEIGIYGYPKTIFVDKNGIITQIYSVVDYKIDEKGNIIMGNGAEIEKEIDKLLK